MAANTDNGALLLVKKFGGIVLIFIGIICIAVGLEYRSNGFSPELTSAGIVALACGMALLVAKIIRRNPD
jgi:small-conductance mechanosensitive channel